VFFRTSSPQRGGRLLGCGNSAGVGLGGVADPADGAGGTSGAAIGASGAGNSAGGGLGSVAASANGGSGTSGAAVGSSGAGNSAGGGLGSVAGSANGGERQLRTDLTQGQPKVAAKAVLRRSPTLSGIAPLSGTRISGGAGPDGPNLVGKGDKALS